jgi:hypothetical protein
MRMGPGLDALSSTITKAIRMIKEHSLLHLRPKPRSLPPFDAKNQAPPARPSPQVDVIEHSLAAIRRTVAPVLPVLRFTHIVPARTAVVAARKGWGTTILVTDSFTRRIACADEKHS